MNVQIIQVPYDSGHKGLRAGRGPEYFLQHGMDQILQEHGHQVASTRIESETSLTTEIGTAFELNCLLAKQVHSAIDNKIFPIVLAGNCNSCLGTIAGIGQSQLGIVWLDAHGDFNTPETTRSGFFDGMGLAIATGRCWQTLARTIPGFNPVPEANILHIGARDLDQEEEKLLQQSEIEVIRPSETIYQAVETAFHRLQDSVTRVYLHVDMDILDAGDALPNRFAVPGGLSVETVEEIIRMTQEKFEVCAGALTSFEPEYDKGNRILDAGMRIAEAFVA